MIALLVGSTFFLLLAAFLSTRFVWRGRLGPPWLLVSLALVVMAGIHVFTMGAILSGPPGEASSWLPDLSQQTISLLVSLLLAVGFAGTERWFVLKERLESRVRLLSEVERSLIGVLDEDKILTIVCDLLSRRKGYRLVRICTGEPDGSVRIVKQAGDGPAAKTGKGLRWDDSPDGRGPTGTALRTGAPCVAHRSGDARGAGPSDEFAGDRATASVLAAPVGDGQTPMALTVHADKRRGFDPVGVEAIAALAQRVGAAVQGARRYEFFVCAKGAYDDILKAQRDGVILVRGRKIVRVNPSAARMLGYGEAEELVGREPSVILADPERDRALAQLLATGDEEGERKEWEVSLRRRDGSALDGEIVVTWVPRESTKATFEPKYSGPLGMVLLRDVSYRRRLEQQIIEMQKMEAVGTLAGGVAHDFNNILTGILGNLDLAQKAIQAESLAALPLQESIKASERAAHMVRQLLDFSRRSPSERRPIDLGKVTGEVVRLFSQAIDKRIEVETKVEDDVGLAMADPNQMHQVLMNLCVNARDAVMERLEGDKAAGRPPGEYRIGVFVGNADVGEDYCRSYPYARSGDFVLVTISDNGAGMDEATQRRVFEPFFSTKKLGRGTGLGLSTVYGIVKQHEGWINLRSRTGAGTTFRVYLPRAAGAKEEIAAPPEVLRPRTGKETILLVDDEEMIRSLAQQVLEIHGYSVITAADGREAIDVYLQRRETIDLVLLDQTMPHLSGSEVLERIRNVDASAKVILSSGYLSEEASRASAFLPKPYRADVLTRVVREVLDRT